MDGGLGLTITGMRNVTIKTEDPSKNYTGAFYGALKVTNCYGNVTVANPHGAAVVYSLDVDNTAGTGNVTITGSNAKGPAGVEHRRQARTRRRTRLCGCD
jgi:hypothetical protein